MTEGINITTMKIVLLTGAISTEPTNDDIIDHTLVEDTIVITALKCGKGVGHPSFSFKSSTRDRLRYGGGGSVGD